MVKKKKAVLLKCAGTLILAAVFSLWPAVDRMDHASVPEAGTLGEQGEAGPTPGDSAGKISSGINPAESVRYRYIDGCPLPKKTQREIFEICAGATVSFELVIALIEKESGFDPKCVSDEGQSVGLMQIQKKWHREVMDKLGCRDLYDPLQNVRVGVELLKRHFETYQDAAAALMAYNGGQAYADRMIAKGEISAYAASVLEKAVEYERRNGLWER
jgi:soluble lytic murein transglycosylase-like protein